MHLVSENFAFFAIAFGALFFVLSAGGQKVLLLFGSYIFCGYQSPTFAVLLGVSTVANYILSLFIDGSNERRRRAMWLGIAFNVAFLGAFKYFNFFSQSLSDGLSLLGMHFTPTFLKIAFPLGISFYTLQAISYLVDIRERRVERADFFDLAIFLSFWPKFVAGPIIRATELLPQLRRRRQFRWANFYLGIECVIYGVFLKTVLSDYLAPQVVRVYSAPDAYGSADALIAALFYTFQIYGDFAGYSLVVIGIARILGYSIRPNFRRPLFSRSFTDFWSRWHISLSRWLRDYVFKKLPARRSGAAEWRSVAQIFDAFLDVRNLHGEETFMQLAGDSLAFVQVSLGLEAYLGYLPTGWETKSIRQLEEMKPSQVGFMARA